MGANSSAEPPAPQRLGQVLVVDDEKPIRRLLRVSLTAAGYEVVEAVTCQEALMRAARVRPDLVILDLGLPDGDGLTVIHQLREWTQTPIIVLSARTDDAAKIVALDAGADDYLTKPFSSAELLARLRAATRRFLRPAAGPIIATGDLVIDLTLHQVTRLGQELHLTATEYALLKSMALQMGKVLTHRELWRAVWGTEHADRHLLRVTISNLRHKLEADPLRPHHIVTEPGVGYRLKIVGLTAEQERLP